MPILCERQGVVYLAGASSNPAWSGWVSLIARKQDPLTHDLAWRHEETRSYTSLAPGRLADIRFFPEIRYRGCKVYPEWWHRESSEPLLAVLLLPSDLDFSKFFLRPPTLDDLQRAMEADGWQGDGREGWHKYVHVDELEKIEGPPPEGPF